MGPGDFGVATPGTEIEPPVGLVAFDILEAEREPWLGRCYVPPANFAYIAGERTYLICGGPDSGKTALFQALRIVLESPVSEGGAPRYLVVHWCPELAEAGLVREAAAQAQMHLVLAACAGALLAHVAQWPSDLEHATDNQKRTLAWFIHRYLGREAKCRGAGHTDGMQEPGQDLVNELLCLRVEDKWLSSAEPADVIDELVKALRGIRVERVYVLVNPDDLGKPGQAEGALRAILSNLNGFGNPGFSFKIVVPEELGKSLAHTEAVQHRRVDLHLLRWLPYELEEIVVKRIEAAAGWPVTGLDEVCEDPNLVHWLEHFGGDSPKGWLDYSRSLAAHYVRRRQAIGKRAWKRIRSQPPPALEFDEAAGIVKMGYREIRLSERQAMFFRYLYEKAGKTCSRRELYERAYLPEVYPDKPPGSREFQKEYDRLLESSMSRIRSLIEPEPRSPLYLITERGEGYRLELPGAGAHDPFAR